MTKHTLKRFMQTIVFSDGSSIRKPMFLGKYQPRVLLAKTDFNNHPLWKKDDKKVKDALPSMAAPRK